MVDFKKDIVKKKYDKINNLFSGNLEINLIFN